MDGRPRTLGWLSPVVITVIIGGLIFLAISYFLSFIEQNLKDSKGAELRFYLAVLAITGALGGVISGFIENNRTFHCIWADEEDRRFLRCGSLADGLIGLGAAWGVFLVLGRSLRVGTQPEDMLVLIGLGVIAGYGGKLLLRILTLYIQDMVQAKEAREEAREANRRITGRVELLEPRVELLEPSIDYSNIDTITDTVDAITGIHKSLDNNAKDRIRDILQKAHRIAEGRLQQNPNDPRSYMYLARVKKRLAFIASSNVEKNALLNEAISLCDQGLNINPNTEQLYYNRACYKALLHFPIQHIIADMKKAIELNPDNKKFFKEDSDLQEIHEQPEIKELLT